MVRLGALLADLRDRHQGDAAGIIATVLVIKSRREEEFMREAFPGEYQRYCEAVPALIPSARPRRSAPG